MNYTAFRKAKAIESANKRVLLAKYPNLTEESGIYTFSRVDLTTGIRYAYVGQAQHLLTRLAQHLSEHKQHIDNSLHKRKLFDAAKNPEGWSIDWKIYPPSKLNEMEQETISTVAKNGYQLLNRTTGSQGTEKRAMDGGEGIGGYRKGKAAGEVQLRKRVKEYFDKWLDVSVKPPTNKIKERKLEEFKTFIGDDND